VEHYLENNDERTKLSHEENTISKRIIHFITSDAEYKLLHKSVTFLNEILIVLWGFLHVSHLNESDLYKIEKDNILALLKEEPFHTLVQHKKGSALSSEQIASYDTAFRFRKRPVIRQILQFIYHLDVYIAVAKVAEERQLCFPKALREKDQGLKARDVFHLLLSKPVSNTIELTCEKNMVFLTGANMAGKSTFMKTLGIAVFLAHAGFPVPASSMEFSVMDGLYTTINLPDNLGMGTSHFYAEVLRVKKVAKELGASKILFIIFDELFRGTNVKDAYEATIAITSAFAKKSYSMFIISTHIIEAGDVLKSTFNNIQFLYLPTKMNGSVPEYTYTLERGITNDRHGMIIIQNERILEILRPIKKETIL
jgi:DNA mismatch repair ATPase MutS